MNKKKIKKYFKILFVPITMLFCLSLFLINTFAQEGYEIADNGNIESLNLFSFFDSYDNGNVIDSRSYFYLMIRFNDQSYTAAEDSYTSSGIKSISFTTPSTLNNMLIKHNGSSRDITILETNDLSMLQPNTTYTLSFNLIGHNPSIVNGLSFNNIMLNSGSVALDYFPVGIYYQPQNFNFMDYLIGNNYFNNGRVSITQTNNNQYWDKPLGSNFVTGATIGSNSINQYINDNVLNLSSLSYDLINLVKQTSNYNFNNFTYIDLLPCLNIPTSSASYEEVQAKYVNISIYCPLDSFTCDVALGDSILSTSSLVHFEQSGQYINISFDSDDTRFVNGIYIVLNRNGNNFVVPDVAISNTNDTISWDLYQLGFNDGQESQLEKFNVLQGQYNKLNEQYNGLVYSNNVLKEQVDNLQDALDNNFGFRNVFFALADTPFKTASNMLGFELFGVNLFNALIGFITVLACIWLLKKFL